VAHQRHSKLAEERPSHRTQCHARSGLASARPLQHGPGLFEVVLLHPNQVGVTRPRARQSRTSAGLEHRGVHRFGAHHLDPFGPLGVADTERDRAAHRKAVPNATREVQLVLLELHPGAAAVAELTTLQVGLNAFPRDRDAGGQALEHGHQFGTMRLTSGQPTQHVLILSGR